MATTSLTGTRKCYEVTWILTYLIFVLTIGNVATGVKWSKMVIAPCSLPMIGVTTNFCCRTQNVPPTATIYFYMYKYYKSAYDDDVVAKIFQPGCNTVPLGVNVTCKQENDELVYNLMYPLMDIHNAVGTWGCRYYANESTYTLNSYQEKPLTPVISVKPGSVITSGFKAEGKIICTSSSQSAAPMYYYNLIQYVWILPDFHASYNTIISWNELHLTDVNCRMDSSLPVYCTAKEKDALSYDSEPFYPHELCSMTPSPSPEEELYHRITTLTGILAFFITAFVLTLVISLVFGRKMVKKQLMKFCKCCHFCCKDESGLDYEPFITRPSDLNDPSDPSIQSGIERIALDDSGQASPQRVENDPSNNIPPELVDDNVPEEYDPHLQNVVEEIAEQESREANSQLHDNNPLRNRPPDAQGAASHGVAGSQLRMEVESFPQEYDPQLQNVIEEIAGQESREANSQLHDNDPLRNRPPDAQGAASHGVAGSQLRMEVESIPQEYDPHLQNIIEEIAREESREASFQLHDNNPLRNRPPDAQGAASRGVAGSQLRMEVESIPQEYDPHLQNIIEEIAREESREASSQLHDNNPLRNRPPDAQGVASHGVAGSQLQMEVESIPQEYVPLHENRSGEIYRRHESRGASSQLHDNNPLRNRPPVAQGAASHDVAGSQLRLEVESIPQEYDPRRENRSGEIYRRQESRGASSQLHDNNPLRNRPPVAQGAASRGVAVSELLMEVESIPQEYVPPHENRSGEIYRHQESRGASSQLHDNNPLRNRPPVAQGAASHGVAGSQLRLEVESIPQEYDPRRENRSGEIYRRQESRGASSQLHDNNPLRNRPPVAQGAASRGVAVSELLMEVESVPQEYDPRRENRSGEIYRRHESRGASSQLHDNNPLRNRPPVAQGAASRGVAVSELLIEVESRLEEFNQSLGEQVLQIIVNRDNIVNNLICYYTDPVVPQSRVQVRMLGEDGMDAGGVMADMYTSFWNKAKEQFFIGCEAVVPYLPAHKMVEEENFRVLGRILSHSVALMKTIPIPLCKSTIIVMIYDTVKVPEDTLLNDFLLFIDSDDKDLILKALSNFNSLSSKELGNLQSIFARYDYAGVIRKDNLAEHLVLLASNEICRKPKSLCELMRAGIPSTHMNVFWSLLHPDHLNILYVVQKPTATTVIARLQISGDSRRLSSGQQKAFQYLKDFLCELSPEELETFVQFVTGKRCTPREPIIVSFSTLLGFQRRPRVHTCANHLELPATYENYDAFKREFKYLLASNEAMIMTLP